MRRLVVAVLMCAACSGEPAAPPAPPPTSFCPLPATPLGHDVLVLHHTTGDPTLVRGTPATGWDEVVTVPFAPDGFLTSALDAFLEVSPDGAWALVSQTPANSVLVHLPSGPAHLLSSILPAGAVDRCGSDAFHTASSGQFRQDGGALLYSCTQVLPGSTDEAVMSSWEIDLATLEARDVTGPCGRASYPVDAPCDMQVVTWSCPTRGALLDGVAGELRRRDGTIVPLPPTAQLLSTRSYLAFGSATAPSTLVALDDDGREHVALTEIDPDRTYVTPLPGGTALAIADRYGFVEVRGDGTYAPRPYPCLGEGTAVTSLAPDGQLVALCTRTGAAYVVDIHTGEGPTPMPALDGVVGWVRGWSSDGEYLLLQSADSGNRVLAVLGARHRDERQEILRTDPDLGDVLAVQFVP